MDRIRNRLFQSLGVTLDRETKMVGGIVAGCTLLTILFDSLLMITHAGGIVNLMTIDELTVMNLGRKWGVSPNLLERVLFETTQMRVQWGKLIKRKM